MIKSIEDIGVRRSSQIRTLALYVTFNYLVVQHARVGEDDKIMEENIVVISKGLPEAFKLNKKLNDRLRIHYFLVSQLFIALVSEVEGCVFDIMSEVLGKYPKKVGDITLTVNELQNFPSIKDALKLAIEKYLNQVLYKRPAEYRKEFCSILSIGEDPIGKYWASFIEMKARRDLGVHNGWLKNELYKRKVAEAGAKEFDGNCAVVSHVEFLQYVKMSGEFISEIVNHCKKKFK